jgi:hypothetical protein
MDDMQAIVNATVATALLAQAANPAAGVAAPHITTLARTPAQARTGLLDYESSKGMKIYNAAVAVLSTKNFGNTADMHFSLKSDKERGSPQAILNVPKDGSTKSIIDLHGLLDLADIREHALVYEREKGRHAKKDVQLLVCIIGQRGQIHGTT